MSNALANLLGILDLERIEENLYRGTSLEGSWGRVFGGQVIAQSLVAAARTANGHLPHSLHAYFLLAGDPSIPILFEVDRIRDGSSFTTRRVKAVQRGQAIFALTASFHRGEEGYEHQLEMPDVPLPDQLPSEAEIKEKFLPMMPPAVRAYFERERPVELRPVDLSRYQGNAPRPPRQAIWFRARGVLPDDPMLHRIVLAYASDMTLLDTSLVAHGKTIFSPDIMAASLDHALWFHRPVKADEWMLFSQDSPSAGGGRGFTRGLIFSQDGTLVASVVQEGLIRIRREDRASA